jgi:hypothetical protein
MRWPDPRIERLAFVAGPADIAARERIASGAAPVISPQPEIVGPTTESSSRRYA